MLWKQLIGAAMGSKPIPHYANIFMAIIDKEIEALANSSTIEALLMLKRFLDDFFLIFCGSTKELHYLFEKIN